MSVHVDPTQVEEGTFATTLGARRHEVAASVIDYREIQGRHVASALISEERTLVLPSDKQYVREAGYNLVDASSNSSFALPNGAVLEDFDIILAPGAKVDGELQVAVGRYHASVKSAEQVTVLARSIVSEESAVSGQILNSCRRVGQCGRLNAEKFNLLAAAYNAGSDKADKEEKIGEVAEGASGFFGEPKACYLCVSFYNGKIDVNGLRFRVRYTVPKC